MSPTSLNLFSRSLLKRTKRQEATFHYLPMAKELPHCTAEPGVFHLFNENRTFYFESDISSLPDPPCTISQILLPTTVSKMHKSQSQPHLPITEVQASPFSGQRPRSAASHTTDDLHKSTAIMASASSDPFHSRAYSDSVGSHNSLESRYQTEPTYRSNEILKSFKHEFKLFGGKGHSEVVRKSVSSPGSPRRPEQDIHEGAVEEFRSRSSSDSRKLSMVKEESTDQVTGSDNTGALAVLAARKMELTSPERKSDLDSVAIDTVDSAVSRTHNLPLTQQVMGWLTSSQTQVKVNRTEFNAMTPQSF